MEKLSSWINFLVFILIISGIQGSPVVVGNDDQGEDSFVLFTEAPVTVVPSPSEHIANSSSEKNVTTADDQVKVDAQEIAIGSELYEEIKSNEGKVKPKVPDQHIVTVDLDNEQGFVNTDKQVGVVTSIITAPDTEIEIKVHTPEEIKAQLESSEVSSVINALNNGDLPTSSELPAVIHVDLQSTPIVQKIIPRPSFQLYIDEMMRPDPSRIPKHPLVWRPHLPQPISQRAPQAQYGLGRTSIKQENLPKSKETPMTLKSGEKEGRKIEYRGEITPDVEKAVQAVLNEIEKQTKPGDRPKELHVFPDLKVPKKWLFPTTTTTTTTSTTTPEPTTTTTSTTTTTTTLTPMAIIPSTSAPTTIHIPVSPPPTTAPSQMRWLWSWLGFGNKDPTPMPTPTPMDVADTRYSDYACPSDHLFNDNNFH